MNATPSQAVCLGHFCQSLSLLFSEQQLSYPPNNIPACIKLSQSDKMTERTFQLQTAYPQFFCGKIRLNNK